VNYAHSLSIIIVRPYLNFQETVEWSVTFDANEFHDEMTNSNITLLMIYKAVVLEGRLISGLKRRLKPIVVAIGKSALRRPWIKRSVLAILNTSPELKNRLYRLVWKDIALAPRAMRIYTALSTSIPTHTAAHNKGND
jgi:hypothetical protein